MRTAARRSGPSDEGRAMPSRSFIELTRNIELAKRAPWRFEPTVKGIGDVVI